MWQMRTGNFRIKYEFPSNRNLNNIWNNKREIKFFIYWHVLSPCFRELRILNLFREEEEEEEEEEEKKKVQGE